MAPWSTPTRWAQKDAVVPDEVRIYAFGGTQHGPAADPPSRGIADNLHNPARLSPHAACPA